MDRKKNPLYQILFDLSKNKISYKLGRNKVRVLLKQDKYSTNWAQIIPLVLNARGAALHDFEEEGLNYHQIEEKELIRKMVEKIPLIKIYDN